MANDRAREEVFSEIERRIDAAIRELCALHYDALTQEHQLTPRIADTIQNAVAGLKTTHFGVGVQVRDFPDKGRGALEHQAGADLYISTVLQELNDEPVSKGLLAQAKWDNTFHPDKDDFVQQAQKMRARTSAAYVWTYGPHGVRSIPIRYTGEGESPRSETPGEVVANSLRCKEGDLSIGRDPNKEIVRSLNEIMREIAAKKAVAISVVERPRPGQPTPRDEAPR